MRDQLLTYLSDHLSGARFALDLLEHIRQQHMGEPFGLFAGEMLQEIENDRVALEQLFNELGGNKPWLKELAASMAEKVSHLKLRLGEGDDLAKLETLEALSLGVLGKQKLWAALTVIAHNDPRLQNLDLPQLLARAQSQHDEIEKLRLKVAHTALIDRQSSEKSPNT